MPRNDAAERYSPPIAEAFSSGLTDREATKKSDVVRETRTPNVPMTKVASTTATIAATGHQRARHRVTTPRPGRRTSRSLRSAART